MAGPEARWWPLRPAPRSGPAKRWPPDRVAQVARALAADLGATPVLVGARGDLGTIAEVLSALSRDLAGPAAEAIDLGGRTDLLTLAGVFTLCDAVVSNDSGAMHVAAAVGVPVTAIFGPTNEQATSPLPHPSGRVAAVVVGQARCRPCLLRAVPDRPPLHDEHRSGASWRRWSWSSRAMRRAVFLDRDGTMIEERGYLNRLDLVAPFPYTADAIARLRRAGFAVVVVTNQAGIARGLFDEDVRAIGARAPEHAAAARRDPRRVLFLSAPSRRRGRGVSRRRAAAGSRRRA